MKQSAILYRWWWKGKLRRSLPLSPGHYNVQVVRSFVDAFGRLHIEQEIVE